VGKGISFRNRNVAKALKRVADRELTGGKGYKQEDEVLEVPRRHYLGIAIATITAAAYNTTPTPDTLTLGTGTVKLWRRKHNPASLTYLDNQDGNASYKDLERVFEADGTTHASVRVWNRITETIVAGAGAGASIASDDTILLIVQDAFGDYYIAGSVGSAGSTVRSATLTADLAPGGNATATIRNFAAGTFSNGTTSGITVYDDNLLATGETVASGKRIIVSQLSGTSYLFVNYNQCG